jgi:trimeric autotransporter adhesin
MALKFRRGTTAQQSGSLAYGEPYVNTDLGTLLVGGASGDIQLSNAGPTSTFAGASVSASTFVSASSLKVTGNAAIDGNLTLGGNITIGDNTSDTVNVTAALSSSLIPQTTNAFDLGSADKIWRDLYISTGSIKFVEGSTVVKTLSPSTLTALESQTGSYASTGSNTFRGNQTINGLVQASASLSAGYHTFTGAARFIEGQVSFENNNTVIYGALDFMNQNEDASLTLQNIGVSGSNKLVLAVQELEILGNTTLSGSFNLNGYPLVNSNQINTLLPTGTVSGSSQVVGILSSLNTYTGSLNNAIQLTGSTVSFLGDIVVYGTQSIINSTNLAVADNLIYLNNESTVTNPDLGIVGNYNDGTYAHSGIFRDASDGGAWKVFEGYTVEPSGTINTAGNGFTLADFKADAITATSFNGAINATNGVVSGSSQIDHNSTTNYVANKHIDHTSVLISAGNGLSGGGDISSTRTLSLDTTSATFTTGVKSKLDADGVISSSAQLTSTFDSRYLNTGGDGVVSGSSQIAFSGVTGTVSNSQLANSSISGVSLGGNLATLTIGTGLSGTSYNGSSLVTIANTGVTSNVAGTGITVSGATGAVTITNAGVTSIVAGTGVSRDVATGAVTISIGQSVATNATPTFGNLTINGTITATGDITAFFTSDIRHKNNVTLIDNALDKVNALNGVTWEWNDDVDEVTKQTPTTGLIAQDVLDVLPEVVKTRENGFLALDYSKMIGLLVEAIKEQDIVIQKLKSDMVGLNTTITVFEDRMKEKGLL